MAAALFAGQGVRVIQIVAFGLFDPETDMLGFGGGLGGLGHFRLQAILRGAVETTQIHSKRRLFGDGVDHRASAELAHVDDGKAHGIGVRGRRRQGDLIDGVDGFGDGLDRVGLITAHEGVGAGGGVDELQGGETKGTVPDDAERDVGGNEHIGLARGVGEPVAGTLQAGFLLGGGEEDEVALGADLGAIELAEEFEHGGQVAGVVTDAGGFEELAFALDFDWSGGRKDGVHVGTEDDDRAAAAGAFADA